MFWGYHHFRKHPHGISWNHEFSHNQPQDVWFHSCALLCAKAKGREFFGLFEVENLWSLTIFPKRKKIHGELRSHVSDLRSLAAKPAINRWFQSKDSLLTWLPTKNITWSISNTWFDGIVLCWSNFSWIPSTPPKKIWHLALEPRKLKGNSRFSPPHSRPTCDKKVVNKAPFVACPFLRRLKLAKEPVFSSKINPT